MAISIVPLIFVDLLDALPGLGRLSLLSLSLPLLFLLYEELVCDLNPLIDKLQYVLDAG